MMMSKNEGHAQQQPQTQTYDYSQQQMGTQPQYNHQQQHNQYPQQQSSMMTVGAPQQSQFRNNDPNRWFKQFSTGAFACMEDAESCRDTCLCWHVQVTSQYNTVYEGRPGLSPLSCLLLAALDVCFVGLPSIMCVCATRGALKQNYNIVDRGDEKLQECCLFMGCCCCCMVCQQHREMVKNGQFPGGCLKTSAAVQGPEQQIEMGGGPIQRH